MNMMGFVENNDRAKERTESIVVTYVKGVPEKTSEGFGKRECESCFQKRPDIALNDFQWKIQKD